MRHWPCQRNVLSFTVFLVLMGSLAFVGCNFGGTDNNKATVNGTLDVTATNAAALGGLTFTFSDGALFGFSGQSTTLAFGNDGSTFTLTAGDGSVLNGTITFGSCTLTQNPVPLSTGAIPFMQTYDPCQVIGKSDDDIAFGGSGTGTITLRLGNASIAPVTSSPTHVIYHIDAGGNILINDNMTRIGVIG
jgi:hypothetical protein